MRGRLFVPRLKRPGKKQRLKSWGTSGWGFQLAEGSNRQSESVLIWPAELQLWFLAHDKKTLLLAKPKLPYFNAFRDQKNLNDDQLIPGIRKMCRLKTSARSAGCHMKF